MSQEQTLHQLLSERVATFAAGDRPREIVDQHVEKMFADIIGDCFRSYGDLGQKVRDSIKAALPANVDGMFELTRYNDLVATALRDKWESSGVAGDMVRRAQESIDEILKEDAIPSRVSLLRLLEQFADDHKEQACEGRWEAPRITIETNESSGRWKWVHIYFDEQPDDSYASERSFYSSRPKTRETHELKNRLMVLIEGTDENGHDVGRVCDARLDDQSIGRHFRIHGKRERLLAALYFGAADLVIDCDEDDISYGIYD